MTDDPTPTQKAAALMAEAQRMQAARQLAPSEGPVRCPNCGALRVWDDDYGWTHIFDSDQPAPPEGLVLVRENSGGVFPDGTTNTPAIDFDAPPVESAPSEGLRRALHSWYPDLDPPDIDVLVAQVYAEDDAARQHAPPEGLTVRVTSVRDADPIVIPPMEPAPSEGLREPESWWTDEHGRPMEVSDLSRAMDKADDVMTLERGHRSPSWSTEEYAAAVRVALTGGHPALARQEATE